MGPAGQVLGELHARLAHIPEREMRAGATSDRSGCAPNREGRVEKGIYPHLKIIALLRYQLLTTPQAGAYSIDNGSKPFHNPTTPQGHIMTFQLETGFPIPPRLSFGAKRGSKYPFAIMEVGDSFAVPSDVKPQTVRSAIGAFNKTNKITKFAVREMDGGTRVWRIEDAEKGAA